MSMRTQLLGIAILTALGSQSALHAEEATEPAQPTLQVIKEVKPFRTFLTIQKYNLENSGKPGNRVFNAQLEITFSNGVKVALPEGGTKWPIGNGQSQEINRTFEIPWELVQSDTTKFTIAINRSGATIAPCEFSADQLSQFNRGYVCHTDAAFQAEHGTPEPEVVREAVYVRVFTDKNSTPNEIPKDALAFKK